MILIAIGANMPHPDTGGPRETCEAALRYLDDHGVRVSRRSPWYRTAPVPPSEQPDFVNGVAALETGLDPEHLLAFLHETEAVFGRERGLPNAARTLDIDLIDYHGRVAAAGPGLRLPHPRMHERGFVLIPLRDVAPEWTHPVLHRDVSSLIKDLAADPGCEPLD